MRGVAMKRARPLLVLLVLIAGCGDAATSEREPEGEVSAVSDTRPKVSIWKAPSSEDYPLGKEVAAKAAAEALTYARGDDPERAASRLGLSDAAEARLARVLDPAVEPDTRSAARVEYVQLSGLTPTSLGAMVVVEQRLEDAAGGRSSVTRVLDVRLVRTTGPWRLDEIASVGGSELPRPDSLSAQAAEVLDSKRISLPDSARWDIYRGEVDPALLETVANAAEEHDLAVTTFSSGHPPNVWATDTRSAHADGFAVDIWAVDGTPVIAQREVGSGAYELASDFVAGGAVQLGSPWILGPGGSVSFADEVHADHLHLQQSPLA